MIKSLKNANQTYPEMLISKDLDEMRYKNFETILECVNFSQNIIINLNIFIWTQKNLKDFDSFTQTFDIVAEMNHLNIQSMISMNTKPFTKF